MPQGVRLHVLGDAGALRVGLHDFPERHARERAPAVIQEKSAARVRTHEMWPPGHQIRLKRIARLAAHGHDALLRSFAEDSQEPLLEIDLLQREPGEFGDPQSARVEQFQQRPIPQPARIPTRRRRDESRHLRLGKRRGNLARGLRAREQRGEIVASQILAYEKPREHPQCRQLPREARHRVLRDRERLHPRGGLFGGDGPPVRRSLAGQKRCRLIEIAPVARDRVVREPAL